MNEKGANLGSVMLGIEQRSLAAGPLIAAVKSFSFAPAAAAHDERGLVAVCAGESPATTLDSSSATKYVPSAMSWVSTP